jgi:hypothetical protein
MKVIHKDYQQPFLVEPTKLNRIVGKIHERLADHANSDPHDSFEVFLTGSQREEMTTLEEVLALDNSWKHKIERLVILCSASTPNAVRPEYEVQVDFASLTPNSTPPGSTTKPVTISVRGDAAAWASRTLSEVEEQVERTWLHHTWHTSSLIVIAIVVLVALLFLAISQFASPRGSLRADTLWLYDSDVARIETMLREQPALTDEQVREIFSMQLRNVLGFPRRPTSVQSNGITRTVFIVVLLKTCYPSAVFLWGDEVDRYAKKLQRRKILWNIVVGVAVVGVLSNFFFEGLSLWLPRGHS